MYICLVLSPLVRASVYINADLTKAETYAAYQYRCRRRALTAACQNNSNNANNATDNPTSTVISTSSTAAPTDNLNTSAAGASKLRQQQILVQVSGVRDDNAGRPRQS